MQNFVKVELNKKGYQVNENALSIIGQCDAWYSNMEIEDFHCRKTIQGVSYHLNRMNFAKRCCADDANLCEVLEINAGTGATDKETGVDAQATFVNEILRANEFNTQYRQQLELTSANGTVACYIRLDNATLYDDGKARGGDIRLNYVDADSFIPLTVDNGSVIEAAFCGTGMNAGKKETTLVLFTKNEHGMYIAETIIFDEQGNKITERSITVTLGDVKPFAVMRNAEVNNLKNMAGYGLPKLLNAIPALKVVDLAFNVLYSDLDKAEKIVLVNELLCNYDKNGKPIMTPEQKKLFVLLGEKLPEQKNVIQEYNPEIRIEEIENSMELALSMLSMSFGYGTKKYGFENGQITTATEYIGERQDQMQELNRQRQEACSYISGICKGIMWFANQFLNKNFDLTTEILVDFDDSYVTDKVSELERKRNDALSFDIPKLTIWYLMDAYNLTEEEATKLVMDRQEEDKAKPGEEDEE